MICKSIQFSEGRTLKDRPFWPTRWCIFLFVWSWGHKISEGFFILKLFIDSGLTRSLPLRLNLSSVKRRASVFIPLAGKGSHIEFFHSTNIECWHVTGTEDISSEQITLNITTRSVDFEYILKFEKRLLKWPNRKKLKTFLGGKADPRWAMKGQQTRNRPALRLQAMSSFQRGVLWAQMCQLVLTVRLKPAP